MITNTNHFSFTVSSVEQSINFYHDVLGLEILNRSSRDKSFSEKVTGIKGAELEIVYFQTNNVRLELIQYLSPTAISIDTKTCNVGSSHICFNVDNFDDFLQGILKSGVKINGQICIIPEGPNKGKKVVYFDDPDGNTIELISVSL